MSQSLNKLFYHIVWTTKNRLPLINDKSEKILTRYIPLKARQLDCEIIEMNMVNDHIHLLVTIPCNVSVVNFISRIKGSSSHKINEKLEKSKHFSWQSGYACFTITQKDIKTISLYIQNQKMKHVKQLYGQP